MKRHTRRGHIGGTAEPIRLAGAILALGLATSQGVIAQAAATGDGDAGMDAMRTYLVDALERAKAWDISLAEAIPDSAMEWAPNPGVRGFAAQVVHAANNSFLGTPLFGEEAPAFGDPDVLTSDRAALVRAITAGYDWLIERVAAMSAEDLQAERQVFGQSMPRWRICLFALEHAMWTRGQLVPYLHAHGVPVPQQMLF